MKIHRFPLVLLALAVVLWAAGARANDDCYWAQQVGSTANMNPGGIAVQTNGNILVTGWFSGTADFNGVSLVGTAPADVFVVKFSGTNGSVLWARKAGGTDFDRGQAIAVDAGGNAYVTGSILGAATFGGVTLTNSNSGDLEIFVAKYDPNGNVLWARQAGATAGSSGWGIAVDGASIVVVTGYFEGRVRFGSTSLTNSGAVGTTDLFVVKYDTSGNVVWARKAGGSDVDSGNAVGMDAAGNSYVAGTFGGTATFGATNLTSLGSLDVFLSKYDGAGQLVWVRQSGGTLYDDVKGIATDAAGNSHLTGRYESNPFRLGVVTLANLGGSDTFVAKYNSAGQLVWAVRDASASDDSGNGVAFDSAGNVTATGYRDGEICMNYYTSNGTLRTTTTHQGVPPDKSGVGMSAAGYAYVFGSYSGAASFNEIAFFASSQSLFLVQRPNTAPANDFFANRAVISNGVHRVTASNFGASKEYDLSEPEAGNNAGGKSVWWSWTAPTTGRVRMSSAGSSFSPLLAVYRGTALNNLTEVAFSYAYGVVSEVNFDATAGTNYVISLDGFSGGSLLNDGCPDPGNIVLTVGYPPTATITAPANNSTTRFFSNVVINATAADADGTVTNLSLYDGAVKVAETAGGPLTISWQAPSAGTHSLVAVATDNDGFRTLSTLVNMTANLGIVAVTNLVTTTNFGNFTVNFTTSLRVQNLGTAPTGPLRLRLVARAGYSMDPFRSNAPPALPPDRVLRTDPLLPGTLAAGATTLTNLTSIAPAPSNSVSQSWLSFGWGVYALLEEQVGTNWLTQDRRFLLYGVWPSVNGSQGPGAGVIRLDPSLTGGGFVPVALQQVTINGVASITEGLAASYYATAVFSDAGFTRNFTNTDWTATSFGITTGGVFTAGSVTGNTAVTLTCPFTYSGATHVSNRVITVLNLPSPVLTNFTRLAGTNFALTIKGVPARRHVLEAATNLNPPAIWTPLSTNQADGAGLWRFTNSPATGLRRFYRARETQ